MKPARQIIWPLLATLGIASTAHADAVADLAGALAHDSEITLHFRSHYLDRDKSAAADSLAWAAGGWLGYRSGWAGDTLRLGLTAYASQKLYGPADQDGAALLLAGQKSYAVLGEAYGALKFDDHVFTAGRFLVNQFEVNPQDTRMTPRTFQGISLAGRIGAIDYYLARLDKMKHRNWDYFEDVATVAGAPANVDEPLLLLSLRAAPDPNLNLGFASYLVRDVLASSYADVAWTAPLDDDTRLRLGAQFMRQGSTGDDLLTGTSFDTWSAGLKAELIHGPVTLSAIAMKTGRGAAWRMPFGSWPGYTSRIINNFNRAGEDVLAIDAAIDFARLGAPGLAMNASATFGNNAIDAASSAALSRNAEYDITFDYRFSAGAWPHWTKPLWLRARSARFEQKLGGHVDVTTEQHLILNYSFNFK